MSEDDSEIVIKEYDDYDDVSEEIKEVIGKAEFDGNTKGMKLEEIE